MAVPFLERDAWVNAALGLNDVPDDESLQPGGVPYLPASVDSILQFIQHARIGPEDVVVDVGSGIGRVCALIHLLTKAKCVGFELQQSLVERSRRRRWGKKGQGEGLTFLHGDAVELTKTLPEATHYFLYCPFDAATVERWLTALPRKRPAWLGCVDFPLPQRDWLEVVTPAPSAELDLYRCSADLRLRPEPP